ncbi:hypothetical protein ACFFIX_13090 [Metabacillus herbersteinensis]|uniref:Uncharacterized protein n=1 Tax=Metabacillus herbersteinensis TaxID=283816 RepID=A0ABV6GFB3_9BACI
MNNKKETTNQKKTIKGKTDTVKNHVGMQQPTPQPKDYEEIDY